MTPDELAELGEVDSILAMQVEAAVAERPLDGTDLVAVRAIVALSRAGAALMTDASHANSRDVARLSERARAQLDDARGLMIDFARERRAPATVLRRVGEPDEPVEYCERCGGYRPLSHVCDRPVEP